MDNTAEILKQDFRDKCARHKLRITPQRTAIYKELIKRNDHPSAEFIYKSVRKTLPNISFDTVYRTLLTFTEAGLLDIVEGYSGQKRFEPNLNPHHHLRCLKCGGITDFANKAYDSIKVPGNLEKGFRVLSKKVVLEGVCEKCRGKKE